MLAAGAVEAAAFHVAFLLPRLRLAFDQRSQCEKRMKELLKKLAEPDNDDQGEKRGQRDVNVILSYPGLGTRIAATLLAEAEQALSARAYNVLRSYSGAAPVTRQSGNGRGYVAYDLYREAMDCYEKARKLAPPGVDDPILRWNTCARLIEKNPHVRPAPEDAGEHMLE